MTPKIATRDLLPLKLNPEALVYRDSLKAFIQKLEEKMFLIVQKSGVYPEIIAQYEAQLEAGGYICTEEGKDRYLDFDGMNYKRESEDHKTLFTNVYTSYQPLREEYETLDKNLKLLENQIMYFKSYLADVK